MREVDDDNRRLLEGHITVLRIAIGVAMMKSYESSPPKGGDG
jgi:hypothetical protein